MLRRYRLVWVVLIITFGYSQESICYGTTSNGALKYGIKLPSSGDNYTSYSSLGNMLGRTYVHSEVQKIIVESYEKLETLVPSKVFKYAECGFEGGGKFRPHKTHQNGLSVDFMVPIIDKQGKSLHLPTNSLNKFGYNIEFDTRGKYGEYRIDYEAMSAHIMMLHKTAIKNKQNLWRVIFDPKLQPNLFKTKYGKYLKKNIKFLKKRSWVRHDEHYHVDFSVSCKKLRKDKN